MARITQIEVRREYLISMGYENARFGFNATAVLNDGDDPDEEYEKLVEYVDKKLEADIEAFGSDE